MASIISAGTASNTAVSITGDTTGVLALATNNGTTALTIDTSQNVGIGLTSPTSKLTVRTADGDGVSIQNAAGTAYRWAVNADNSFSCVNTGIAERMRITTAGNLMLGATTGTERLTLATSSVGVGAAMAFWANAVGAANELYVGQGGSNEAYFYNRANNFIAFGTNNTERVRITSAGEVCIKTTSSLNSAPLTIGNGSANDFLAIRGSTGVDGVYVDWLVSAPYGSNSAEQNRIRSSISSSAVSSGIQFMISDGGGASTQTQSFRINRTSCTVVGSLSKGSGAFKIDHPLPAKTDTHHLVHSFIEGPQADLIYRGKVNLVAGTATVNIDTASGMTEGTFEVLCREVQCFTTNESDWTAVRGSVTGSILTIEAQDNTSTASISWMVIGERKDKHMYDTEWTDENGKVIVEPLKISVETTDSNQGA